MFSVPINKIMLKSAQKTIKAVTILSNSFYSLLCTIYDTVNRNVSKHKFLFDHKVYISI